MSKEVFDIVDGSIRTLILSASGFGVFWKMFEYLSVRAKEKSVGQAKIIEMFEKHKQHEEHLEKLDKNDERQEGDIAGLKSESKEMFKLFLEVIRK